VEVPVTIAARPWWIEDAIAAEYGESAPYWLATKCAAKGVTVPGNMSGWEGKSNTVSYSFSANDTSSEQLLADARMYVDGNLAHALTSGQSATGSIAVGSSVSLVVSAIATGNVLAGTIYRNTNVQVAYAGGVSSGGPYTAGPVTVLSGWGPMVLYGEGAD
jgi:hypothetical protein